jgi:hypothetical protein
MQPWVVGFIRQGTVILILPVGPREKGKIRPRKHIDALFSDCRILRKCALINAE